AFQYDVLTESLFRRAHDGYLHERTLGWIAAWRARTLEPALLNRCDTVFVFSERDRGLLQKLGVNRPVLVVDPIVKQNPAAGPPSDPPTVLFVGAMDRPENHQGAVWMVDKVWPLVETDFPKARLVLAGSSPPESLLRRHGGSVAVTGYVDDLEALYREATVIVAPNLTGAGVKFKVLDAMSHGLPVVATPIAAEGIVEGSPPGVFAAITGDPQAMAAQLLEILEDPDTGRAIGRAAREWVRTKYDLEHSVATMLRTYRELTTQ
ncbi:MAG: glycosyltransferase family 4 protein, partial [Acidimicrobiia bacterium]